MDLAVVVLRECTSMFGRQGNTFFGGLMQIPSARKYRCHLPHRRSIDLSIGGRQTQMAYKMPLEWKEEGIPRAWSRAKTGRGALPGAIFFAYLPKTSNRRKEALIKRKSMAPAEYILHFYIMAGNDGVLAKNNKPEKPATTHKPQENETNAYFRSQIYRSCLPRFNRL